MNADGQVQRVLAVGAHPDDVEMSCVGTLKHMQNAGFEVHIATLTLGDCGSKEFSAEVIRPKRRQEAENACKLLGATYHYVGFNDFAIFNDDAANRRVTALLRDVRPAVVITHPPADYMLDHETASVLVRNACFYAPAPNYDTLNYTMAPAMAAIPHLYYFDPVEGVDIFGKRVVPQFYIDITATMRLKTDMLACHESQRNWLRAHHGMDEYLAAMERRVGALGREAAAISGRDIRYAEAFRQHLGHPYPAENLLASLLSSVVICNPAY